MSDSCIFCKIVRGEIPSKTVHEDDDFFVFHDIRPIAPVHFLVIPKRHVESLAHFEASDSDLIGRMLLLGARLAPAQGLSGGFRTMINTGKGGGQEVFHVHAHIFGGGDALPKT
ncbi:MAG: histidine triad nucleotide-binding protein [Betaproteobacteria bacterium]|jgi:histidine triad (HIT) family protein|nr:histidine triad nucleotide-binding protein [Betaproteobacteria bacterium]NBS93467.1 histidine triad nucleotide-binding protein [Betaproteobacteria bacterium]NBU12780.1 histidine triad nucleotide-binding protein [Betaproteobacteria bacterium]NBY53304.1 histidine triad nucleotide-binding protein [Betaproteobacteria bacterium]NCA24295.1 histidine triad nucleotide-binding protein [Betaproteobacteria bacterium]